ncbi:MAG: hypothetical protein AB7O43_20140, partial [Hyphomicrobiaceae bacterium]
MTPLAERRAQASQAEPAGYDHDPSPIGPGAAGRTASKSTLRLLINSGGDSRIAIDPATCRTPYGTPAGPAPDEIWLSSSTASAVSERGYAAAGDALDRLFVSDIIAAQTPIDWLDSVRARLLTLFGIPGTEVVLSASGTETELIALTLARAVLQRPLTNIVLAPAETGSGVMRAASGSHFLSTTNCGEGVSPGMRLAGLEADDIRVAGIHVRDGDGRVRPPSAIDEEAEAAVEAALRDDRGVLLHLLETSKTGLGGLTQKTARQLAAEAGDRLIVVVDACQLRCEPETIRAELAAGFMVMITGSKFAGGPPYCGALLVPPTLMARLTPCEQMPPPPGLAAYCTRSEWPEALRGQFCAALGERINFGVGLRWEAALAEIERYFAVAPSLRSGIATAFSRSVEMAIADRPFLQRFDPDEEHRCPTIVPVVGRGAHGHPVAAAATYRSLIQAPRSCHL